MPSTNESNEHMKELSVQQEQLLSEGAVPSAEKITDMPASAEDTPKAEASAEDTPKTEAPTEDTPKAEAPTEDTPKAEAPTEDTPKAEASTEDTPKAEASAEDTPKAEASTEDTPKAEASAEDTPKTEAPTENAAATSPTQEPPRHYYERYEGAEKTGGKENSVLRFGRVRNTVLAIVLAISLLSVSLLGGVALGRATAPIFPTGTTTQNQGGGSGGSDGGTGSQPPIDRGDLVLNVVERVEGAPPQGSVPAVVAAVQDAVVEIALTVTTVDVYHGEVVSSIHGSGVLISSENEKGLLLTCHHVIEGADKDGITVTLSDGREFSGSQVEVLGSDLWSDVALLRIREENGNAPENLTYATLATSGASNDYSYMSVGETAIVIGNPLGTLGGSVTVGVVSALIRDVMVDGIPMSLFQTDAATNPGNSGGAVFNAAGEMIGLFNAGINGVEGISFAVPSADVIPLIGEIYTQGYVSDRPFLGLYFTSVSGSYIVSDYLYNHELTNGKTIQPGDFLTHIDGKEITSLDIIRSILGKKKVGDTVTVTLVRTSVNGGLSKRETFEVSLIVHESIP